MAWTVKSSLQAVPGKAINGGACPPMGEPCRKVRSRVRLILEMDGAFVGTVDIDTDMTVRNVRVEVRLSSDGEHDPDGEGRGGG